MGVSIAQKERRGDARKEEMSLAGYRDAAFG